MPVIVELRTGPLAFGRVLGVTTDSLMLASSYESTPRRTFALQEIDEIRYQRGHQTLKGLWLGGLIGAGVGFGAGVAIGESGDVGAGDMIAATSLTGALTALAVVANVVGA